MALIYDTIRSFKLKYSDSHRREMIQHVLEEFKIKQPFNTFNMGSRTNHNFEVTKDLNFGRLYKNFMFNAVDSLNKFSLSKRNSDKCWAFLSSENHQIGSAWYTNSKTATINGVYYLRVFDNCGCKFLINGEEKTYKPKNDELLIFPSTLKHYPIPSTKGIRISINMEILTNEEPHKVFED